MWRAVMFFDPTESSIYGNNYFFLKIRYTCNGYFFTDIPEEKISTFKDKA